MKKLLTKNGNINYHFFFWAGLLILMLIRVFYFGMHYFTYLDDNNTYGVFNRRNGDIWNNIVMWYGLYTFRPIAFMCDAYITQWFWPNMWPVLLFYTLMQFATIYLFDKTMKKSGIPFGPFGIMITAITPILLESVYWIGASTRLVPGMFFSVLSCYILVEVVKNHKKSPLLLFLYFSTNLISTGFYEQIIVFNFLFTLFIIALHYKQLNRNCKFIIATPFITTFLIGAFYIAFWSSGKVASRGQITGGLISNAVKTLKSIANLLVRQNMIVNMSGIAGFFNIKMTILQGAMIGFVILFSAFTFVYCTVADDDTKKIPKATLIKILAGIILTAAPFAPFFVLKNNFMALRNISPSIFGIAMVADGLFDILGRKKITAAVTALFITLFFIINITEINNYRLVEQCDDIIIANFLEAFEETGYEEDIPSVVFNIEYNYAQTSRDGYENISSSDWAFLGKANSNSEKYYFKTIVPVRNNGSLNKTLLESEAALFAIDDEMQITRLFYEKGMLIKHDGSIYGIIEPSTDNLAVFVKR